MSVDAPPLPAFASKTDVKIPWLDLFWTFTDSLYLTTFKLLFIGSSGYIIYLMLNDYKPTHDPNLDTFKVQYLLGISAILALLFPHDYRLSEVRDPTIGLVARVEEVRLLTSNSDSLDVFYLVGVRCDPTPTVHVAADWRSGYHYYPLLVCLGSVQGTLYSELDLPILHRGRIPAFLSAGSHHRRHYPDLAVLGLLLHLLQQVCESAPRRV